MLLSMTGHGDAAIDADGMRFYAEVRTVNNRYLKLTLRGDSVVSSLESKVEALIRKSVRRGHVNVSVSVERSSAARSASIDADVLANYVSQTNLLATQLDVPKAGLDTLLQLPGVVCEPFRQNEEVETEWPHIERTIAGALAKLYEMRAQEGAAMLGDLQENCKAIAAEIVAIEKRGPIIIEAYRQRLAEKVNRWLEENEIEQIDSSDIVREVGIYSERADISEETVKDAQPRCSIPANL